MQDDDAYDRADEREMAQDQADDIRAALEAILDAVDYTCDACRPNEPVGTVLPQALIENAREALAR